MIWKVRHAPLVFSLIVLLACNTKQQEDIIKVPQWQTHEISLTSEASYENPYTDVEVWVEFTNQAGAIYKRPCFWDGDNIWKVRFSPTNVGDTWQWKSFCSDQSNKVLAGQSGTFQSTGFQGSNQLLEHGLLKMSKGKRNVIHADGTAFLVVGDTPWALPFRATKEQVLSYAADRKQKGFNTALLMSVQPDMEAEGPNSRNTSEGFARGFEDLSQGHINNLEVEYFQYLDSLIMILLDHEIVPVFQPVFHGYGWKGKKVLGNYMIPNEYVRYCKYLLARYGSQPAMWLLAGDNGGRDPGVKESGIMMEAWDCYQQPTGLHYNPCDDYIASWAENNPIKHCEHYNKTYQSEAWLDFQWAQSGHSDEHLYHKVERMYDNKPTKASANGEPTYEGMAGGKNGLGWWQGEEAWSQLMSGGTMGVVYGAAGLWQWMVSGDEPGWPEWTNQNKSWDEALQMEGSKYVGLLGKILKDHNLTDIMKRPDLVNGDKPLLAHEGDLYISYLNNGGEIEFSQIPSEMNYQWIDPKSGDILKEGMTKGEKSFMAPKPVPTVLIISKN